MTELYDQDARAIALVSVETGQVEYIDADTGDLLDVSRG